ncbi:putative conserved membrane protein [Synechococcus sp. PROS-7-1]|nr:putative conserved membrane protein [Synechococcus sp. PROS-7-1]
MLGVSTQRSQVLASPPGRSVSDRGLLTRLGHPAALIITACLALITVANPAAATLDDEDMIQNQDSETVDFDPDAPAMKAPPPDASER